MYIQPLAAALGLKAGWEALNLLGENDAACVATVLLLCIKNEKESPLDERCKRRAQCTKILGKTYGWASQTTTAFFCGWFIRHLMNYSSMLSICKGNIHSHSPFINHAMQFDPWKYLWRYDIFLLDMFTARQTDGNRINVAQGCPQTIQYFRCCTINLNLFDWDTVSFAARQ